MALTERQRAWLYGPLYHRVMERDLLAGVQPVTFLCACCNAPCYDASPWCEQCEKHTISRKLYPKCEYHVEAEKRAPLRLLAGIERERY